MDGVSVCLLSDELHWNDHDHAPLVEPSQLEPTDLVQVSWNLFRHLGVDGFATELGGPASGTPPICGSKSGSA